MCRLTNYDSVGTANDFTWAFDKMGKRTSAVRNGVTTTYTPEAAGADVNTYDSITGQLVETGLDYDLDGNMTVDGTWTYTYDAENRLVQMEKKNGTQTLQFTYDYRGRRVQKTVRSGGPTAAITASTKFVWSGWNMIAELDAGTSGTGTAHSKSYLWGSDFSNANGAAGGAGGLLAVRQDSTTYFPAYDVFGNVTGYLDAGNGNVVAKWDFNPFGSMFNTWGSTNSFGFNFATKFTDTESTHTYFGLRYYSRKHGNFINRDPIGEAGDNNLYSFAGNGPTRGWDVLGLIPFTHTGRVVIPNDDPFDRALNKKAPAWSPGSVGISNGGSWGIGMSVFERARIEAGGGTVVGTLRDGRIVVVLPSRDLRASSESGEGTDLAHLVANAFGAVGRTLVNLFGGQNASAPYGQLLYEGSDGVGRVAGATNSGAGRPGHYDASRDLWIYPDGRTGRFSVVLGSARFVSWWHSSASNLSDATSLNTAPSSTSRPYWTGTVGYRQGGFILGGGSFSGAVVGPSGQTGMVKGYIVSAGLQIGIYDGSVQATFSGSPSGVSTGANGGFFSGQLDIGYGPVQIVQAGGNLAAYVGPVNADLGAFTPNNAGPGLSTNTSPADPAGYLDGKLGLGGALTFNGFVVTEFFPTP